MKYVLGAISALVVVLAFYFSCLWLDKKLELGIQRKKSLITEKSVWLIAVLDIVTVIYIAAFQRQGFKSCFYIATIVMIIGMSVLSVTDIKKCIIPNKVLAVWFMIWILIVGIQMIFNIETGVAILFISLAGAVIGGIIFLLCYILSKGQMGAGDVKLVFVLGLYMTGQRIMGAVLYGALLCCAYSIIQMLRKKISIRDAVPMAPFIYMGMCITLFIL